MKVTHVIKDYDRTNNSKKKSYKMHSQKFKKLKVKKKAELTELDKITVLLAFTFL